MIYSVIGAAIVVLAMFLLLKKSTSSSGGGNVDYVKKGDNAAQGSYENIKFPKRLALSVKELLELSWKFLYDLTETVLNKFSIRDQQDIVQQGRVMVENGMKYQHIVDSNPKVVETYTKKAAEQQTAPTEKQR